MSYTNRPPLLPQFPPSSYHQSTLRHQLERRELSDGTSISKGGNQSQAMAKESTSSSHNASTPRHSLSTYTHDLTSRYDRHQPPSPLQPHNSNVPHGNQRYWDRHSSPSPRNQERSRSPPRRVPSLATGRRDYHHDSSPAFSPHREHH